MPVPSRQSNTARIVIAKTALDGHWRGPQLVAHALGEAGYEVELIGMRQADEIIATASERQADLIGLHIGGHVAVAEQVIEAIRAALPEVPIFVGGVVPPWAKKRLEAMGVEVYPPGSQMRDIINAAARLTGFDPVG
ncbi:MAG: cobalamin-dependent protein [Alphaproteobacteria bacterium]|jgi:methylmalonyl-CoA mutase C-terminal domain/subunit|nr:cobalamin-dependent protein [Alphaproteobacteria bacterium]MDP6563370.1 cobalamin-dependent protein [Alphaproteobacteria bacterium]MDP6812148.1 cobalamin-dependent protein [Alphaproteobacteria bacterium]